MSKPTSARIEAVRRFSRFYTKQIGILDDGLPESPFSRTEGRVLCELAHHDTTSAGQLADALGIDAGYLSRILRSLEKRGVLLKTRSTLDRRQMLISLSGDGIKTLEALNTESRAQIARILSRMSPVQQKRTVDAMQTIESLLEVDPDSTRANVTLRPPGPGDMGWVVQRHGELYHDMRGWDATFEALVGKIAAKFLRDFDPRWERGWIADLSDERVGSIFLTRRSKTVGQLRMLLVEPAARGRGLGARLVGECVSHARHVGYKKMGLYTSKGLDSAKRLYEAEGFQLVSQEAEDIWGKKHTAQWWELIL